MALMDLISSILRFNALHIKIIIIIILLLLITSLMMTFYLHLSALTSIHSAQIYHRLVKEPGENLHPLRCIQLYHLQQLKLGLSTESFDSIRLSVSSMTA